MLDKNILYRLSVDSGITYEKMIEMSPFAEKKVIEGVTGKRLMISKKRDYRKVGRGNPLIARHRIKTIEEVDEGLANIKWKWDKKR